jgi:hypothetical protein
MEVSPVNRLVFCALLVLLLAPPAAAQQLYPFYSSPTINRIVLDNGNLPARPLGPNDVLQVTLYGTPGAVASFDVAGFIGIPMNEIAPGIYQGDYRVQPNDLYRNVGVTCHLGLWDGSSVALTSTDNLFLEGTIGLLPQHLIYSVVHNGGLSTLRFGDRLRVTMVGVPGGLATFDVGSRRLLPMTEVTPGTYVGTLTVGLDDQATSAAVIVHLLMPDGQMAQVMSPISVGMDGDILTPHF